MLSRFLPVVGLFVICNAVRAQDASEDRIRIAAALQAADELRNEGSYEDALGAYEGISQSVAAVCGMAYCHLRTGHYEEAENVLDGIRASGEDSSEWHRAMADVLAITGRYHAAITHARRALAINADDCRARYALGQLYEQVGAREDAVEAYRFFDALLAKGVPKNAADLTAAAGGFLRFSVMTRHPNLSERTRFVVRDLYQQAYQRIDRTYWPARLAAADLLRTKSRKKDAAEDYQAALKINGHLAAAHAGLGFLALDGWDFEAVEEHMAMSLKCNPRSLRAIHLEAALNLTLRRYEDAKAAALRALDVNSNDVASLGYAAAACVGLNDAARVEVFRRRAYAINPRPADFHRIVGDTLSALRQYGDSESAYLLAIEADPTDPRPRTELGLMYMQWGEERKADAALATAWELDDFDDRTLNTLSLLSGMHAFSRLETEHFIIKYDASVDAVLPAYLASYLEEIHEELAEDYEWTPSAKTIIELFPTHRMFGVRITGKPWIHTVGACTGRVIALESPRDHPQLQGAYNIARVLRHEYTHTVTLAATGNRIPHWFTEGLAVMQEDSPRPWSWCEILAGAVRRGELFTLETIDWGFMRPQTRTDRQMAYAQSEWMCRFIVERFGYSAINRMIVAYRDRKSQPEVLTQTLQLDVDQFDTAFAAWAAQQAALWGLDLTPPEDAALLGQRAIDEPDNADVHARLARAENDAGMTEQAVVTVFHALRLDPENVTALTVLGEILWLAREELADAGTRAAIDAELVPAMRKLRELAPSRWIAPKVLGTVALERRDYDGAVEHFKHLKKLLPLDPASDRGLAGIHLARADHDKALPHLLELARADADDAEVSAALGMIYERRNRLGDAKYWYTQSLYADAFAVKTHVDLADVCERLGDKNTAVREYQALCALEPDEVAHFERAVVALNEIGQREAARKYAKRAVALDPDSSARSLLGGDDQ